MTNDATFEKIEAWLDGQLPKAETQAFEVELTANAELAAEVGRHRRGREALARLAEQRLQLDFAQWRETLSEIPPPPSDAVPVAEGSIRHIRIWLLWVGGLLVILASLVWFKLHRNVQEPASLQKQETIPPPGQKKQNPDTIAAQLSRDTGVQVKRQLSIPPVSTQLISLAATGLSDFRNAILRQHGQTMGEEDAINAYFKKGLQAFETFDSVGAKLNLLQVPVQDPYFPSAREVLALLYFKENNYAEAASCYESFAQQNSDPATDWRLLQFYLADYQARKADFWKKLNEIANPANTHRFRKDAVKLKATLQKMRIADN